MSAAPLKALSLAPAITTSDLKKSMHFYIDGLGFEIIDKNEADGVIRFVMLQAGEARVGLGQDDFAKGKDRAKGVGQRLWIRTTQDLVELANRAKAAGIKLDSEPAKLPWGPLAFALTDPDGFMITIANNA
jgi:lactoylglutathione lyase